MRNGFGCRWDRRDGQVRREGRSAEFVSLGVRLCKGNSRQRYHQRHQEEQHDQYFSQCKNSFRYRNAKARRVCHSAPRGTSLPQGESASGAGVGDGIPLERVSQVLLSLKGMNGRLLLSVQQAVVRINLFGWEVRRQSNPSIRHPSILRWCSPSSVNCRPPAPSGNHRRNKG